MKWGKAGLYCLMIGSLVLSLSMMTSCESKMQCDAPNKTIFDRCCLDDNDNGICDNDEKIEAKPNVAPIVTGSVIENIPAKFFTARIFYGDENNSPINEVFAGDSEAGKYYLWIKNTGDYNILCQVFTNKLVPKTGDMLKLEKYKVRLAPGEKNGRLYTYAGGIDDPTIFPESVECGAEGIYTTIEQTPTINKYSWRRYGTTDDPSSKTDNSKKINFGENITILKSGTYHAFTAIKNTQTLTCTINDMPGNMTYVLDIYNTVRIGDFKVTLVDAGFNSCNIMFW